MFSMPLLKKKPQQEINMQGKEQKTNSNPLGIFLGSKSHLE